MANFLKVNLQLFNDGEASTPTTTDTSGSNVVNAPQQSATQSRNPLSNVVYGKTEEIAPNAQGTESGTEQKPDGKSEYARVKEQYKEHWQKDVESIIKDRFKKYNTIEQQYNQYDSAIKMLMERHGAKDFDSLKEIIEADFYEDLADKEGLPIDKARELTQMKQENQLFKTQAESVQHQQQLEQKISDWYKQADALKQTYPDFNIDNFGDNKQFTDLLMAGIDVKTAYEICDIETIKSGIAKQTERNVVQNLQTSKGKRPVENGTNITPGITVKSSVKDLSKVDRAEIARRAMLGEKITF